MTDGTPFHKQHHDIARQHHDAARRAAEAHRGGGHTPGHPTGSPIGHGRGNQHGQFDWDRPATHYRATGSMRSSRRSGGGAVIFGLLVVILVLGGIAAVILGNSAYQQGKDRAKAVYCEQAIELTGETPPEC